MTLILGERAFAGCPKLRSFGTSDTGDVGILRIVTPNPISIGKDAFVNSNAHTLSANVATIDLADDIGINNFDITTQRNIIMNYTRTTIPKSAKIVSAGDISIISDGVNPGASFSLDLTSTGGSVILDSLRQVVSLTLGTKPSVPQGKTLGGVFATAGTGLTTLRLVSLYPVDMKEMLAYTPNIKSVRLSVPEPSVIPLACFADKTLLEDIIVTGGITTVGEYAFANCTGLKRLQIGSVADTVDVTVIERGAFYKCSQLATVKLTDRLKEIGDVAFMDSGISGEMIIPKNVSKHGVSCFLRCNITKLTYLCNLLEFVDPTTINFTHFSSLIAIPTNIVSYNMNGNITIYPGPNVTPHTIKHSNSTINVNNSLFIKKYNSSVFNQRIALYKSAIDKLYSSIDSFNIIDSMLGSKTFTDYKAVNATKATKLITNLSDMRSIVEDYIDYMKEGLHLAQITYYQVPSPNMPTEMLTGLAELFDAPSTGIDTILTELSSFGTNIRDLIYIVIINRNVIIGTIIPDLIKCNAVLFINGDTDVSAPYNITTDPETPIKVTVNTNTIEDYSGPSEIVKINNDTYIKYSTVTTNGVSRTLASVSLDDGTIYTSDTSILLRLDDYYNKYHINVIENIFTIIGKGVYDNKDIDFSFSASKIVKINSLKEYKNATVSITAPSVIIGINAMEEFTDSTITINAEKKLRIEDCAFGACQNVTLNISAGSELVCGSEILAYSSLVTINTNKELINIPAEPIILNNVDIQYWDKSIKELLQIVKDRTMIDTDTAFNVEYTTFTAEGSVNPIFAISFRTKLDLKEYTVIIPPNDYYWAYSVGTLVRDAADFKMEGQNLVYYPDQKIVASRSREWNNGIGRMGVNTDGYGLTNNFAPSQFTYKGYTFRKTETVNNRSLRQVCSNNGEALSERRKNNIISMFLFILEIISLVTIVIPVGAIATKLASYAIKGVVLASKAVITLASRITRIGRLLVKVADIVADGLRNTRMFIKAGNSKFFAKIARKTMTCGRDAGVCQLARQASNSTRSLYSPQMVSKINKFESTRKLVDDAIEIVAEVGDDGADVATSMTRSDSVKLAKKQFERVNFTAKPKNIIQNVKLSSGKQTANMGKVVTHNKGSVTAISRVTLPDPKTIVKVGKDYAFIADKYTLTSLKNAGLVRDTVQAVLSRSNIATSIRNISSTVSRTLSNNITSAIRYPAWKKWAIGTGVGISIAAIAIGTAVGVTRKQGARDIINTSSVYIESINGIMTTFENAARNINSAADFASLKAQLITNITSVFTANTDLTSDEATRLVTAIVNYMTDDNNDSQDNYKCIITLLTDIINNNNAISSEEASDMLDMIVSFLNSDLSSMRVNEKIMENFSSSGKLYENFNNFSVKHIAMYNILDNLYMFGIPPTSATENTGVISSADSASIYLPNSMDELIQNTPYYTTPPYVSPMSNRDGNIRSVNDTYTDGLVRVVVQFGSDTSVSYTINSTWKDKFDVQIDKPTAVTIVRVSSKSDVRFSSGELKYLRIISSTVQNWTQNNTIFGDIRTYNGPDKVEVCTEPATWLSLDTYVGLGIRSQEDKYTERDSYGNINGPYNVANPLLLSDNYMWDYTMLRTLNVADNGDFAALQVPYVETNDSILDSTNTISDMRHKSGLFMGWNSVKYELSGSEDSVVNVALGSAADLVINYVNSTATSIPEYAYCSPGLSPVIDAGSFSVAGVTLPNTLTSIGKKAFYRSGINYAIIPSSIRSISQQAFAESGLSAVKFVDSASIKKLTGGQAYIHINGSPIYTDLYDAASFRGEMKYTRGDVMLMNPKSFSIHGITYNNPQFVLMLRATINNLEYNESPGVTKIAPTIFDQLWVDNGWVKAESYIISFNSILREFDNNNSYLKINNSTTIEVSNLNSQVTIGDLQFRLKGNAILRGAPMSITINGESLDNILEIYLFNVSIILSQTRKILTNQHGVQYEIVENTYKLDGLTSSNEGQIYADSYIIFQQKTRGDISRAIEDSIDIGFNAFADNTTLDTLVLPETIRNIGDGAFAGCTALTTVTLPPLKTIGNNVFADCTALTQVTLPPNIESIGANVFDNCPALSTIKFDGVPPTSINPDFFKSIGSLDNKVTIIVPPQYAPALINAIKSSGINLGSSSSTLLLTMDTNGAVPYFPMMVTPTTSRVKETLFVYSSAAMKSLKEGSAINPATKYVSWLAGGAAYDGMTISFLGRKVYIYTTDRHPLLKYVFMNVQLLSSAIVPTSTDREPYLTGWVCTFSADGIYPQL